MPITEKQRELRRNHIGGSDVAAILGLNPWATAWDVWADKRGMLEDWKGNDQAEAGTHFEDGVLQWAEKRIGKLVRNQYRSFPEAHLGTNIDALAVDDRGRPVEVKTAGLFGPLIGEWGEDGSDVVPDHVFIQATAHMIVTEADLCHVAAFLGGRGFAMFQISRNDELVSRIVTACKEFWEVNVLQGVEPQNVAPSLEVAKRLKRVPNKIIELSGSWLTAYEDASEKLKAATDRVELLKAKILGLMGDAEGAEFSGHGKMVTYMEQTQHRKAQEAKDITFRTWAIKKAKGEQK